MDKIKKQFKDFWTYFRLLRYGANASDKTNYRKFLPMIIVIVVCGFVILGQISAPYSLRISMFLPFLCGVSIATGKVTSSAFSPSLIGVSPYTPKQRIVFSYLATLLRAIIITVIWTVFMIVIMLLMALIAFVISGENVFVAKESAESAAREISAYGYAHEFLLWIMCAFSAYAISHLNSKKVRNIAVICFLVGLEILVLILVNACGLAEQEYNIAAGINDGLVRKFWFASEVSVTIGYLAQPWVVIVVEAVLCVAAIAASVYASVMRYKSSKI